MKKLAIAAALLLSASAANAGESYSFEIGGRTVRIHAPNGCDSPSCISISIPGVYNARLRDSDDADAGDSRGNGAPPTAAPTASNAARPPAPASASVASVSAPAHETAPTVTQPAVAPATSAPTTAVRQQAATPSAGSSAKPHETVVATAPSAAPTPAPVARSTGPLGMWLTEKKEGRVRIEECGTNLCGYSVDARTGQNKEKVLINMKPSGSRWSGRIYDPNSGSTYSSTIAMKGTDALRVQGCAFGGLFCGGQTWTRID